MPLLIFLVLFTVACSPTQKAYYQNFTLFLESNEAYSLSQQEVIDSNADLILVSINGKPAGTMALAYIELGQYKWVGQNSEVFVLEQGRIIRQINKEQGIEGPSISPTTQALASESSALVDWYPSAFAYNYSVKPSKTEHTNIRVFSDSTPVYCKSEAVTVSMNATNLFDGINQFCFSKQSNSLLMTEQLSVTGDTVGIVFVSRVLRERGLID